MAVQCSDLRSHCEHLRCCCYLQYDSAAAEHVCCSQSFLQRCQNYLQKVLIEQIPMRLNAGKQRQFMRESGLRVRTYEQGYSTSVAAIFAADWALYPHPVSPKVHVSPLYIIHNTSS